MRPLCNLARSLAIIVVSCLMVTGCDMWYTPMTEARSISRLSFRGNVSAARKGASWESNTITITMDSAATAVADSEAAADKRYVPLEASIDTIRAPWTAKYLGHHGWVYTSHVAPNGGFSRATVDVTTRTVFVEAYEN